MGEMKTKCPLCNYEATNHTEPLKEGTHPVDGDVSLCIECGEFSEYKGGELVQIKIEKINAETESEMKRVRDAWVRTQAMARLREDKDD